VQTTKIPNNVNNNEKLELLKKFKERRKFPLA
jgi:hypothetical protein